MMAGAPMGGMGMMPAPAAASGGGDPLGYVAVACIVLTLVFSTWGVLGGTWLVPEDEIDGIEMHTTLRGMYVSTDISEILDMFDATCDEFLELSEKDPDSDLPKGTSCDGNNMIVEMNFSEDCEDSDDDDMCDLAGAGLYGSITLGLAVAAGLGAAVLIIFNIFGIGALPVDTQKFGFIAGVAAGVLAGISVLVWYLMLPDGGEMNSGLNVWLTITGAVTGIAAGILTKLKGNPSA
jgi:hypothetical protein